MKDFHECIHDGNMSDPILIVPARSPLRPSRLINKECALVAAKINILFAIDYFHRTGGTERHLVQLVRRLDPEQFSCRIVVFDLGANPLIDELCAAGIPVIHVPVRRIYTPNALRRAFELAGILRNAGIDIVQTFHQTSDTFGAVVAKLAGVRRIISSKRDTGELKRPIHVLLNRCLRSLFDRVIVVADAVGRSVVEIEGIDPSRIVRIYNGVDAAQFLPPEAPAKAAARRNLGLGQDDFVVGMVAGFRPEKDHATFFTGVELAMKVIPSLKAVVIGGGPLLERYQSLYGGERFRSSIIFAGDVKDVSPYVAALDVGCLIPNANEGFSNAVLENMAMGLPMVVTAVGGNAEAVLDGESGLVVAPADPDAFCAALVQMHSDPARRLAMGRRSRELVEERYGLQQMCRNHEALFRSLFN